ncbi:TMEM175 family protein [Deinococcus navajonensis]|uniref:TMEM175 family protein n=1 Tax=Deinococcus navajonensis TaxID=309884 RepID=A0ABV8XMT4_9DEIO
MTKSRLEAFSDGVLAIIITIMVLELPRPESHEWHELGRLWPTLLGYVLSFLYVGIYWNNHHHLMHTVRRVNGSMLWANLHLLFWLSLLPYMTGWAGESHFAPVPVVCYAFIALMCAVAYLILVRVIIRADPSNHLLSDATGAGFKEWLSVAAYLGAIVAPLFGRSGVPVAGVLLVAVALMWLIPDRRIERVLERTGNLT